MERLSLKRLSELTGKSREKIAFKLTGLPSEPGPNHSKTYLANHALERIYVGQRDGLKENEAATEQESRRLLNIAKTENQVLQTEIAKKERIPLEDVEEINNRAFANIAGILKREAGKVLTGDRVQDMLEELRAAEEAIRELGPKE